MFVDNIDRVKTILLSFQWVVVIPQMRALYRYFNISPDLQKIRFTNKILKHMLFVTRELLTVLVNYKKKL